MHYKVERGDRVRDERWLLWVVILPNISSLLPVDAFRRTICQRCGSREQE